MDLSIERTHSKLCGTRKYIIDEICPGEETSYYEIFLYAALFAGFHYYYNLFAIIETFFFALIYGYLYLKTKSLVYGIVLGAFTFVFLA